MPWRAFFERLLALAGTTPEPDFDRERAETIRTRSRGIWAAATVRSLASHGRANLKETMETRDDR